MTHVAPEPGQVAKGAPPVAPATPTVAPSPTKAPVKLAQDQTIRLVGVDADTIDPQIAENTNEIDTITGVYEGRTTAILHGWKNDEVDQLVRAADVEQDWHKRLPLYTRVQAIVVREAPVIFVYYTENILLVKPYILGYTPMPGDYYMGDFGGVMNLAVAEH